LALKNKNSRGFFLLLFSASGKKARQAGNEHEAIAQNTMIISHANSI
jgi:hypothetical protein